MDKEQLLDEDMTGLLWGGWYPPPWDEEEDEEEEKEEEEGRRIGGGWTALHLTPCQAQAAGLPLTPLPKKSRTTAPGYVDDEEETAREAAPSSIRASLSAALTPPTDRHRPRNPLLKENSIRVAQRICCSGPLAAQLAGAAWLQVL